MTAVLDRRDRLDHAIGDLAYNSQYTPVVRNLECLRGISSLTAFGLAVEIGDWERFTGRSIGAYLGLVPSEHSSGQSWSQGSITKTCIGHARRPPVDAAWHHRQASPTAQARGHAGNRRLHERWMVYLEHKKRPVIANVAIARGLAGWCWSLVTMTADSGQNYTVLAG